MAKLIYITNITVDCFIEDRAGAFDWSNGPEAHVFITDLLRGMGSHLYGRRLYETMAYWESPVESYPPEQRAFAQVWHQPEKIVFSRTLTAATTRKTRIVPEFDPQLVQELKRSSERDLFIGGAELAGLAFEAGLVDECHLFIHPVIVGGGKPALQVAARRKLELLEEHRFESGTLHLHYRVRQATPG